MKVLFLTTEGSSFWTHRLTLARRIASEGAEVVIMVRSSEYDRHLENEGFRVLPWEISRRSLNPIRELRSLLQVLRTYRNERPDVVHHIALKPIIYGGIAAGMCGDIPAVNNVTGLGPVFTNSSIRMRFLRRLLSGLLKWVCSTANCKMILQNQADRAEFVSRGITVPERTLVTAGFGVDTGHFIPLPEREGAPVVMLPARMLWEKGVGDFVAVARELRKQRAVVRMVLVGASDRNNIGCIAEPQLREWADEGIVEWWGQQANMASVLCESHVVCLPTYGEGLPKVLLEAASCGRPIVTTNAPGCSDVVGHEENGLIVPLRNPTALATALLRLLQDPGLRARMGAAGRERAVKHFSDRNVADQIVGVYQELLKDRWTLSAPFDELQRPVLHSR